MKFAVKFLERWRNAFDRLLRVGRDRSERQRRDAAILLIQEMVANMPVWSGRAVSTVRAVNGSPSLSLPHPDRGNTLPDGDFRYHEEFGRTSLMRLGDEPQRARAEAMALASVDEVDFGLEEDVTVASAHYMMGAINQAEAPTPEHARNKAVVDELAREAVRNRLGLR